MRFTLFTAKASFRSLEGYTALHPIKAWTIFIAAFKSLWERLNFNLWIRVSKFNRNSSTG